jgi:asparagine N-glycosylation enzyme membrane subunit Stt3
MKKEEVKQAGFPAILRYILGIFFFFSPFIICLIRGLDITLVFLGLLTPPLTFMFLPPLALGVYFIISKKWHLRMDSFFMIISLIAEGIIFTFSFGKV